MNTPSYIVERRLPRMAALSGCVRLTLLCCLVLALGACAGKTPGKKADAPPPPSPNEKRLAYGVSLNLPPTWKVFESLAPETPKTSLDTRRGSGERPLLLATLYSPTPEADPTANMEVYVVSQQNTFMPYDIASKFTQQDLDEMAKDIKDRENALLKKNKRPGKMLELQLTLENVSGKMAIKQRWLLEEKGLTRRAMNWDIYLPNGAGIAIRSGCEPEAPGAEQAVNDAVRSMRIQ